MSLETNKAVVRRYFEEARSTGDLAVVDQIYADEYVVQTAAGTRRVTPARQKKAITIWRRAFPDYRDDIVGMVAEGDQVAVQVVFSGTHTGLFEYEGMGPWTPTGRAVRVSEYFVYRLVDGKIGEQSAVWDRLAFVQQLGIGEMPAANA
jgi:steroid delta-isomerase-like uncharacterized protein